MAMTGDDSLEQLYARHHRREQAGGKRLGQAFLEMPRAKLFREWIGDGKVVLDLGCRDGTLTRHFLEGNRVTGADIDSAALGDARGRYGLETRRVNLNGPLPFDDRAFDAVLLAETLEHLPYPSITLAEIRRVLRDGGAFIGNVPLSYHLHNRWRVMRGRPIDRDPSHLQHFSYESLRHLLQQFFSLERVVPLKGRLAGCSMRLFARNVAFLCRHG